MATGSRPVYAIQPVFRQPPIHRRLTQALAAPHEEVLPCLTGLDIKHPPSGRRRVCVRLAAAGSSSFKSSRQEQNEKAFSGSGAHKTTEDIKAELYLALQGTDRGVFGITSAKKSEIKAQVKALESMNPTPNPTDHLLYKVDGCWKLIYSTVTILGSKRTKLGLRDFISLGDLYQTIDVAKERAVNVINFNAKGLKILTGRLTIEASYKIASKTRVNIKLENSSITPDQFMNLFQKKYDLLIEIFNPEGWLDITYVDESMRIGRDAKGNIFVLERAEEERI